MPTTLTDPKVLAAKYNQAFNSHDETALGSLIAPDARFSAPGDVRLQGKDAVIGYTNGWMKALPDAKITVTHEIVSAPWVVQEFTFEGTHEETLSGPGGDIPATHRHVTGRAVQIVRIEGGAITATRLYFDQVELLTQLGLMPEPATARA